MNRNHTDDITFFIAFCIEMYKNARILIGASASAVSSGHGVMEYLADNYEVPQGPAWILEEIDSVIQKDM